MISTQNLQVAYGDKVIIKTLNLNLPEGEIIALIGPNGCGKSTLLRTLARINKPAKGEVLLNNKPLSTYNDKLLAREISLLPQVLVTPEGINVQRLVEYGRSPYLSHWGKLGATDRAYVDKAMQQTE